MNRRRRPICLLLCLLLTVSLAVNGCGEKKEVVKETELSVRTAEAGIQDIAKNESYAGTVRGKNEVYIMPKIAARVTGIYVKAGDRVRAGQTLVTLDNSDFQAGIKQAEAAVTMAEASKRANDVAAETARSAYERTQKLYEAGAASAQQLEAARSQYESLVAGTADAAIAQAQAGLQAAQSQLDKCTLTSPIDGVVGTVSLSLGDTANVASPAAIVTDVSELEVQVMVSESDVSFIKPESPVDVLVKEVSDQSFKGVVKSIASVADPEKRNYLVKVSLPNQEGKIKSGMFAEVKIATESKSQVVCVPASAVLPQNGRTIVYTVDKNKRARSVEIQTGIKNDRYIEVTKGLKAGQTVIVKGNTLVNDGTLVRVVTGGAK